MTVFRQGSMHMVFLNSILQNLNLMGFWIQKEPLCHIFEFTSVLFARYAYAYRDRHTWYLADFSGFIAKNIPAKYGPIRRQFGVKMCSQSLSIWVIFHPFLYGKKKYLANLVPKWNHRRFSPGSLTFWQPETAIFALIPIKKEF